jgi:putative tricarboxylic transport membrane protein
MIAQQGLNLATRRILGVGEMELQYFGAKFGTFVRHGLVGSLAAALISSAFLGGPGSARADDYPSRPLQWTVPFGAGGGSDQFARLLAQILKTENLYSQPIVVTNREGGSGAVGWAFQFAHAKDPYQISSTAVSFFTTPLQANPGWTPQDFVKVGLLATDVQVLLVPKDSPYKTLKDFIDASQKKQMAVGGVSVVSSSFLVPQRLSQVSDFKFKYVSFNGQGQALSGVLSSSLDALVSNPGDVIGQLQAGTLRPLAQSGSARIDGPYNFKDVPTFKELGYDVVISQPRGIVLAPNVDKPVVDFWVAAFKKVVVTKAWKDYAASHYLQENVLWGDDFKNYVDQQYNLYKTLLTQAGVLK